ncbi:MAG: hypothetical protein A2309_03310 [Bacteroidetes bacterium RIFOXYB2_FULL_35_7]|nr:MAG: hypothetical protein A2X01_17490 [Bacteroidetes bacterium GWF2_35_48]OFY94335.1 MAG: hypothetical protein A2491_00710 [Bacteroidetes bacterium RIFOXYC12_FULL_35_7]OFY97697.1 MAG: hypothetical protein A2309_03310 [Bacteroidetes bacterium RIFOXYB2_FULL_35_7]HBX49625.1 hypothetical protein [Bacteroidales bacterium]
MKSENQFNIDQKIIAFLKKHHVLTLATVDANQPYCCNCFYVYDEDKNQFIFVSDNHTRHVNEAVLNNKIAGSVVLETSTVGKIQGIQFTGIMNEVKESEKAQIKFHYLKKFPFAIVIKTTFWIIDIHLIKMTDNRLGFGKKLIWSKETMETKIV